MGGEAELRDEFREADQQAGEMIADNPAGTREERRRSRFIDLHGDEDNDPNTNERDLLPTSSSGSTDVTTDTGD